jgi:hypothetical protein
MSLAKRVLRHSSVASVLCLAACSGQQKAAVGYAPTTAATYGGGNTGEAPAAAPADYGGYSRSEAPRPAVQGFEQSHAAVEPGPIADSQPAPERPGLGTSWGERVSAPISFAPFVRAAPSPWAEVMLHYNDAEGVEAHAQYLGARPAPLEIYAGDGALSVALVDEAGRTLPGFTAGGRTLIEGQDGGRYRIVVRNATTARFEIVASVDGLDVIDGHPADPNRRGYIVDPRGTLVIDGFRTSDDAVAAFRFGRVADSYAAQTSGDRNVGVVGLAIFAERGAVWSHGELQRRDSADPFPQRGYATPPR